uniref:Uncharacterized protein n=1 Tax=Sphaerodactylus townsendi TaxID=933632 RepID=A0ACB8F4T9_9SAUR
MSVRQYSFKEKGASRRWFQTKYRHALRHHLLTIIQSCFNLLAHPNSIVKLIAFMISPSTWSLLIPAAKQGDFLITEHGNTCEQISIFVCLFVCLFVCVGNSYHSNTGNI